MSAERGVTHLTEPVTALAARLPGWVRLTRAPNPGPMALEGTNTWVLWPGGTAGAVVVDPGPDDEEHLRAVADLAPVVGVLVTHGHPDHVAGLARFQELTGAPRLAAADHRWGELHVSALPSPGHTADSVCYLAEAAGSRVVLTGDTILGRGTTVVAWPDGNLGDYLASLARLTDLAGVPVLPGHGPALADCATAAAYYLAHRQTRLEQVRAALAAGAGTAEEVVAKVYAGLDPALREAAEWSVRATLAYLADETRQPRESAPGSSPLDEP